jgi:hypothetical protein
LERLQTLPGWRRYYSNRLPNVVGQSHAICGDATQSLGRVSSLSIARTLRLLTDFDVLVLRSGNRGHSFEGKETDITKLPPGVIGPELKDDERRSLVEYLKPLRGEGGPATYHRLPVVANDAA